jgi:HAD superfamily hydrolase (TIGR01509 family)
VPLAGKTPRGGLLFDIDGTLAHTDPFHILAFNQMLAAFGQFVSDDDYMTKVMGRTNAAIMQDFFPDASEADHIARANEKERLFREIAAAHIAPMPGLMDLLDWAEDLGIPKAVVTNAPRDNAGLILGSLGIAHRFVALVLGDDLAHGKPHPLPYLTGAERIGVEARHCVAFEDSRSGVMSASRAGALTIGVRSSLDENTLVSAGAGWTIADFDAPELRRRIQNHVFT